jgi:hypothetical protein
MESNATLVCSRAIIVENISMLLPFFERLSVSDFQVVWLFSVSFT